MPWVEIVTVLALLQFVIFGIFVGRARSRYGVKAPATSGHEAFERYFRIHYNTLEQLIVFLPSLWIFALHVSARWGAIIGAVYLVGRVLYFRGYARAADKRHTGSLLSMLPTLVLLVGSLVGLVYDAIEYGSTDSVIEISR